ncbi:MAG: hypothetical protein IPL61_07150 [Myxococcales bacterium]|nr:hypothetical protein [Myxococcales bacterium]
MRPILPVPDAPDDRARLRAMTDDERAAALVGVMRAAAQLLAVNDNRERVLTLREPLSAEAEATLARLRARKRGARP